MPSANLTLKRLNQESITPQQLKDFLQKKPDFNGGRVSLLGGKLGSATIDRIDRELKPLLQLYMMAIKELRGELEDGNSAVRWSPQTSHIHRRKIHWDWDSGHGKGAHASPLISDEEYIMSNFSVERRDEINKDYYQLSFLHEKSIGHVCVIKNGRVENFRFPHPPALYSANGAYINPLQEAQKQRTVQFAQIQAIEAVHAGGRDNASYKSICLSKEDARRLFNYSLPLLGKSDILIHPLVVNPDKREAYYPIQIRLELTQLPSGWPDVPSWRKEDIEVFWQIFLDSIERLLISPEDMSVLLGKVTYEKPKVERFWSRESKCGYASAFQTHGTPSGFIAIGLGFGFYHLNFEQRSPSFEENIRAGLPTGVHIPRSDHAGRRIGNKPGPRGAREQSIKRRAAIQILSKQKIKGRKACQELKQQHIPLPSKRLRIIYKDNWVEWFLNKPQDFYRQWSADLARKTQE